MTNNLARLPERSTQFEPQNLEQAIRFAEVLADSTMVPKDFQGRPGNVLVALQWGREIGLAPLQALQNIAVINGRPSLWGDAILAIILRHPAFVSHDEGVAGEADERHGWCEMQRAGRSPVRREFSIADARKAGLLTKAGPWQQYTDRMLMMRARGFCSRDAFPDALRGLISAEEAMDTPREVRDVPNLAEPQRGPVRAAAGSLAEHAARLTGREVEPPQQAEPEEALPLLYLDGRLVEITRGKKSGAPAAEVWRGAALQQIARAESAEALRGWRAANGPHFGAIAQQHPEHVAEVEQAIEARREALQFAPEPEPEPESGAAEPA